MAAGEDRGHAGNAGYDDQVDAYYSWDSNVPNHKGPQVGDPVAVWDKQRLLGVSVIEHIDKHHGTKTLYRCPSCQRNRISARTRRAPRYRCSKCAHEFDIPVPQVIAVEKYTARYDAAWTGLDGLLGRAELAAVSHSSGDFNAIRRISWAGLCHELRVRGASLALDRVEARVDRQMVPEGLVVEFDHGFTTQVVRVRRGQARFRKHLLSTQGSRCAFTGSAPERVLEAGHLYSYAELGTHHAHGGLMLRRDIHRLFDDGLLAVNPGTLHVDVAPNLATHAQYAALQGNELSFDVDDEQAQWLTRHWDEHRLAP